MKKTLLFFVIGVGFFISFVFFSILVSRDKVDGVDFTTTVRLQDNLKGRFVRPFSWLSEVGSFEFMLIFLIGIFVLLRKWWMGVVAFFFFGIFHVIELFGKIMVEHPPPPQFMLLTENIANFPQFHVRSEYSYPSGHSGRAIFLSVLLGYFIVRSKRVSLLVKIMLLGILVVYDGLMLLSRPYLGEHWISDVIGGVLLALALSFMTLGLGEKFPRIFPYNHTKS